MLDRPVRLSFSPDADDLFMFWPLLSGRVEASGLTFVHDATETETLNARAASADPPDVCAVSIAHVPAIADRFLLLPHGASIGRGYGPVVVARRPMRLEDLAGARVAIPGARTTSHLVLRLLLLEANGGRYEPVEIPIAPFRRVFDALSAGEVDAALLIHEGRLTFRDQPGLHEVVEIGRAWTDRTGLPLPLGGNVVRRDLGAAAIAAISDACRRSIRWALDHKALVVDALIASGARADTALTREGLDRYLSMYANEDSATFAPDAVRAIQVLVDRARAHDLLPHGGAIELAP
jgi:1,4-dihydroxy-6-naphthoate synthase